MKWAEQFPGRTPKQLANWAKKIRVQRGRSNEISTLGIENTKFDDSVEIEKILDSLDDFLLEDLLEKYRNGTLM